MVAAQWAGTAALLAVTLYFVDVRDVTERILELDRLWLLAGLGVAFVMYSALALRWWFTARRVGVALPYRDAWLEYYGSMFVNRVLPVPAAGEAVRVVRHRQRMAQTEKGGGYGPIVSTVILERLSGQVALALLVAIAGVVWLLRGYHQVAPFVFGGVVLLLGVALLGLVAARRRVGAEVLERFFADVRAALFANHAWWIQLSLSMVCMLLLVLKFYCAGRAAGSHLDLSTVFQVVPLVIAATIVPLTSSGWGVREATTALLYGFLGLEPGAGVAVAVIFGLIGVLAVLPGVFVVLAPVGPQPAVRWWQRGDRTESFPNALVMLLGVVASVWARDSTFFIVAGLVVFAGKLVAWWGAWTPTGSFGAANLLTAVRLGAMTALAVMFPSLPTFTFVIGVVIVFALDGLDGWIARRTAMSSDFGATFDMEVDAYLVMLLCLLLWLHVGVVGVVLAAGLWRYVYGGMIAVVPTRGSEPRSNFGRWAFGIMVLLLMLAFLMPQPWADTLAVTATVLVSISFLRSLWWSFLSR